MAIILNDEQLSFYNTSAYINKDDSDDSNDSIYRIRTYEYSEDEDGDELESKETVVWQKPLGGVITATEILSYGYGTVFYHISNTLKEYNVNSFETVEHERSIQIGFEEDEYYPYAYSHGRNRGICLLLPDGCNDAYVNDEYPITSSSTNADLWSNLSAVIYCGKNFVNSPFTYVNPYGLLHSGTGQNGIINPLASVEIQVLNDDDINTVLKNFFSDEDLYDRYTSAYASIGNRYLAHFDDYIDGVYSPCVSIGTIVNFSGVVEKRSDEDVWVQDDYLNWDILFITNYYYKTRETTHKYIELKKNLRIDPEEYADYMINCTYRYLLDFDADMYMSFYKRTYAKSDKIYNFDGYVGYKNSHMTQDTAAWYYTSYNNLTTMNLFWDMLDNTRYQYQQLVLTSYYNDTKYLFSYDSSTGAIELHTWSGENGIKYIGKTVIDKVSSPSLANVISNVPNNEVFYMEKSRSWCGFLLDVSSETKSITDINEGVTYYFTQDD